MVIAGCVECDEGWMNVMWRKVYVIVVLSVLCRLVCCKVDGGVTLCNCLLSFWFFFSVCGFELFLGLAHQTVV